MSRYIRPRRPGARIFFTVTLAQRGSNMLVREIARLRRAVQTTRAERPFEIEAWVVLPDHMHCIWVMPEDDADYSTRWRLIKSRFSRELPKGQTRPSHEARQERAIWQRRFWEHHIRNDADLAAHIRYCWMNPVKHRFVNTPDAWPYSSVHHDPRYTPGADRT